MLRSDSREVLALWWDDLKLSVRYWLSEGGFWRWVARAVGVFLVGVWVWVIWVKIGGGRAVEEATPGEWSALGAVGWGLYGFACLIAGAVFIVPTIIPWVAGPLLRFVDAVYLGSHDIEKPPLTYDVAERLVRERRWQDAAAEFERIVYWHPREERAWSEAIRCAELTGDQSGAVWLERRARLRCPALRRRGRTDGPMTEGT